MDEKRLKNPPVGQSSVPDYFDEMLERIRDIRASERRVYLRVKEIFTMAAELIANRVDANKPDMGLTNYKGGEVRKTDVTIAKKYVLLGGRPLRLKIIKTEWSL
jgi:hypothetical protein